MVKGVKKKTDLEKKVEELEGYWKRALADYQNLERRIKEEKEAIVKFSSSVVLAKLLPVLDNLEKAASHVKDNGLKIIVSQIKDIFRSEGFEEIKAEGEEFNPHLMEAIKVVEGEKDNIVVGVVKSGWMINGKTLRPAQVIVSKKEAIGTNIKKEE